MKKMLLATALTAYYWGSPQQTFTVQNKPGSGSTKGNHHPSFLRFWNWAEKAVVAAQNLWRREMFKNRNPGKHFVNGCSVLLL